MSTHAVTEPGVLGAGKANGQPLELARPIAADTIRLVIAVALITGLVGVVATIGADLRWLAALGRLITVDGGVPHGVPFAAAPTGRWPNTLVLAELLLHLLYVWLGNRGFVLAQLIAVAGCLGIVARDARANGSATGPIAATLLLAALGGFTSFALVRVQLFSLVMFPSLVAVLRADARLPSRRIWLAPALLAIWANLHGGVLLGAVTVLVYLVVGPRRASPLTASALAGVSLLALSLTPAGVRSVDYYSGLVSNLAVQRGSGQWAPLGAMAFDPVLIAAAAVMLLAARRRRPSAWEVVVIAVLAAMTARAGRDGVWLLVFLAPVAAATPLSRRRVGLRLEALGVAAANVMPPVGAVLAVALLFAAVVQSPSSPGASHGALEVAIKLARGTPILADTIPAEQVALAGGRIYVGNPLDAFSRATQAAYLDWVDGSRGGKVLLADRRIRVVIAAPGSAAAALTAADHDFSVTGGDRTATVFARRP